MITVQQIKEKITGLEQFIKEMESEIEELTFNNIGNQISIITNIKYAQGQLGAYKEILNSLKI